MRVLRGVITAHEPTPLRAALGWRAPALAQLLPELREVWPDVRPLPRDEGGAARHLLFEAIAACLRLAAQDCGLLIHLDDVHRGDESSLLLLRSLASDLAESRILVVAAHRPCAGLPASFRSCLTEWALSDRQKNRPETPMRVRLLIQLGIARELTDRRARPGPVSVSRRDL